MNVLDVWDTLSHIHRIAVDQYHSHGWASAYKAGLRGACETGKFEHLDTHSKVLLRELFTHSLSDGSEQSKAYFSIWLHHYWREQDEFPQLNADSSLIHTADYDTIVAPHDGLPPRLEPTVLQFVAGYSAGRLAADD